MTMLDHPFQIFKSCVPISPVTVTAENSFDERQQLPLTLAWALTIHKSQGMTLGKAWINIGSERVYIRNVICGYKSCPESLFINY